MKTVRILGVTLSCLIILATGCRQAVPVQSNHISPHHQIVVGFAMDTLKEERWQRDRDCFTERLQKLGARVIVEHANNDTRLQIEQIDRLIADRVDVLVVIPHDARRIAPAIIRAKKAGIKVVSYDRLIRNAPLNLYISFDNVKVGELVATYLVNRIPSGRYIIINGAPTDNNCYMFNEGYKKILEKPGVKSQYKLTFEGWCEDWRPEAAYQIIQDLIAQKKTFDAVIAANDSLAGAVIEALAEQRLAGKVIVLGHDADLSACQRIVEGTQDMTVYKPIQTLAHRAANMVYALARGENLRTNSRIFNGRFTIPAEIIEPIAIDRKNISILIDDGFHRMEDIYMHVPKDKWPDPPTL